MEITFCWDHTYCTVKVDPSIVGKIIDDGPPDAVIIWKDHEGSTERAEYCEADPEQPIYMPTAAEEEDDSDE